MLVTLCSNLGLLGYFKYGGFLLQNFTVLMHGLGIAYQPPAPNIVLPVGISFYTFQSLSYTLDVYFRRSKPADSFLDFALYVGFFPQLVAGPIVRSRDFLPQCERPKPVTARELGVGASLLVFGLFEKVVLADWLLSPSADAVFNRVSAAGSMDAWMGTLAFSDLEITLLSSDSAVASGRWTLKRANDQPHGRFTLILKRLPEGWRIVHDHTSAAPQKR